MYTLASGQGFDHSFLLETHSGNQLLALLLILATHPSTRCAIILIWTDEYTSESTLRREKMKDDGHFLQLQSC